ncbi:hypothetical protein CLAVI_000961 [Candidatus Clavichlamydia salmonicola]|uniref:hypothetical protein n=1 Tax=Candidatus Clavichlamydia salmonicola TaxID=469812 RepID=UPI001891E784|nr:hypothetical protein [Candidatus Clavichlamydia salmonicola]MBF5051320.1 hypothetical protein [Candidatus Clavichlamydia salmonicola]
MSNFQLVALCNANLISPYVQRPAYLGIIRYRHGINQASISVGSPTATCCLQMTLKDKILLCIGCIFFVFLIVICTHSFTFFCGEGSSATDCKVALLNGRQGILL